MSHNEPNRTSIPRNSQNMCAISAANRVLDTYELLEQILIDLTKISRFQHVILAQRVCRRWRDLIQNSQPLQEACWYRPHTTTATRALIDNDDDKNDLEVNPFFQDIGFGPLEDLGYRSGELGMSFGWDERVPFYNNPGTWKMMQAVQSRSSRMSSNSSHLLSAYIRVFGGKEHDTV